MSEIAACDQKLAQYRAALDAGADPASRRPVDHRDPGPQAGRRRPPARRDRHWPRSERDDQRTIAATMNAISDLMQALALANPEPQGRDLHAASTCN